MNCIKIGNNKIGIDYKPYIIVEACVNHQGNLDIAKKMIFFAKKVGAQCIKFQHHIVSEEMLEKNIPKSSNFKKPLSKVIEDTNFSLKQHRYLKKLCEKIGIEYLCTPFSIKAAKQLNSIKVKAFKTGSGELTNLPFIDYIARIGKPMIVSTGMSLPDEIDETVKLIKKYKTPLAITHCISAYPCPYDIMNLNFISELSKKYKIPVGLSDHTPSIYNALGAVSLGASIIEKHFTFDKNRNGFDHKISLDFKGMKNLVNNIIETEKIINVNKSFLKTVEGNRKTFIRVLVANKKILKGRRLNEKNLSIKRVRDNNNGLSPSHYDSLLGKLVRKTYKKDEVISKIELKND